MIANFKQGFKKTPPIQLDNTTHANLVIHSIVRKYTALTEKLERNQAQATSSYSKLSKPEIDNMILSTFQSIIPATDIIYTVDFTPLTDDTIIEALKDPIINIVKDTNTIINQELELAVDNSAIHTVNQKIKTRTLKAQQKRINNTIDHLDKILKAIIAHQDALDRTISPVNITISNTTEPGISHPPFT